MSSIFTESPISKTSFGLINDYKRERGGGERDKRERERRGEILCMPQSRERDWERIS